jgi:hypothetical protein
MDDTGFIRSAREIATGLLIGVLVPIVVLAVAIMSGAFYWIYPPLAVLPPGFALLAIGRAVSRWLNDRDDPRHQKRPPDAP